MVSRAKRAALTVATLCAATVPIATVATVAPSIAAAAATASITKLEPSNGLSREGNDLVIVRGTGLDTVTDVRVDDVDVPFSREADGTLSFISPAHSPGLVRVLLTTPGGTLAASLFYEELPRPVITSISAKTGPLAGGNVVTIQGSGFSRTMRVVFGNFAVGTSLYVHSDSLLVVTAPPATDSGTVDVAVVNRSATSENTPADDYTYGAQPTSPPPVTLPNGKRTLTYMCRYPVSGEAPIKVAIDATAIPATVPGGVLTPGYEIKATVTATTDTYDAFERVGAVRVEGRVRVFTWLTVPGRDEEIWAPVLAPFPSFTMPAARQNLVFPGVGALPSQTFAQPGRGSLRVGNVVLSLKQLRADGSPVVYSGAMDDFDRDPTIFDVSCDPSPADQDASLKDFVIEPPDAVKPVVTIGAVTQSPKVDGVSSVSVGVLVSEASRASATLSRREFGVRSGANCIAPPSTPPAGPAPARCVRTVWTNPVPSKWLASGAGSLVFPKAPKRGWWTLAVQARDAAGNTGGATKYVLLD